MHFVFDGGTLAADTPIRLQAEELDDYRFVELSQLDDYLPALISTRVAAAVRARAGDGAAYLPWPPPEAGA